jgi:dipeptidyl aminopeptidase/acylaminoacyl peptidase
VHVNATTVPTLVIHGTNDQIVPFSQAEDLVKRLKEYGVPHRIIRVEHGGHAFHFTPHVRNKHSNLMPAVTAFLQEHLKK